MARRGASARLTDAVDARSVGVVCFGAGIVAYWGLREAGEYFGALVPLFLVGIAGLLLGYSNGYDRGREAAGGGTGSERDLSGDQGTDGRPSEESSAESDDGSSTGA